MPLLGVKRIETTRQIAAKETNVRADFVIIQQILALWKDTNLFMSKSILIIPLFTSSDRDYSKKYKSLLDLQNGQLEGNLLIDS